MRDVRFVAQAIVAVAALLLGGTMYAQVAPEPSQAPTEADRDAVAAMLAKLSDDEKELVKNLVLEVDQSRREIEKLRKELDSLKVFHKALAEELARAKAELSKLIGGKAPAKEQLQLVKGKVTSVDSLAPLILVELSGENKLPAGAELNIMRDGKRIGAAKVLASEGKSVCGEVAAPEGAAAPSVLVGDDVAYMAKGE